MKTIQLVIPMSGQGNRFQAAGYTMPKPLVPISGIPMIERCLNAFPKEWPAHFVLNENHRLSGLRELLEKLRPGCTIDFVEPHKLGPSFAAERVMRRLNPEQPVFVSYCDYGMEWDPQGFERLVDSSGCEACVISYRGFHAHYLRCHKYAFSRMEGCQVVEVKEKGHFTNDYQKEYASSGGYYFKSAELFLKGYGRQVRDNLTVNGEYFTSLTVEGLLRAGGNARVYEISKFFQWGTPEDVKIFEYWEGAFRRIQRASGNRVPQILMPMAGLGSRFKNFKESKPLIAVRGQPMFLAALESLPKADHTVVVTLESVAHRVSKMVPSANVVSLAVTPNGQALSTEEGIGHLSDGPLIVSSCDHGIILDGAIWSNFPKDSTDAAIFTVKGYPGALRRPEAFSYVETEEGCETYARVRGVSLKRPISASPEQDALLVGTFWFRNKAILAQGIRELKARDIRVNGELYLDSVFDILVNLGLTVRTIPLDGYLCWGDPDSFAEEQYWFESFGCDARLKGSPYLLEGRAA